MKSQEKYEHRFVESIPDQLDEGILYVSVQYATALHLCMCGCGQEVVTPLSPAQWNMTFDGRTVSLCPSIGNWSFACESHYWLEGGHVAWSERWSEDRVAAGRARTHARLDEVRERLTATPTREPNMTNRTTRRKWLRWWPRR